MAILESDDKDPMQLQLELVNAQTKLQAEMQVNAQILENKRHKLELLKTAKESLIANKSNAPFGEQSVTDEEIVAYAATLEKFLNS